MSEQRKSSAPRLKNGGAYTEGSEGENGDDKVHAGLDCPCKPEHTDRKHDRSEFGYREPCFGLEGDSTVGFQIARVLRV